MRLHVFRAQMSGFGQAHNLQILLYTDVSSDGRSKHCSKLLLRDQEG